MKPFLAKIQIYMRILGPENATFEADPVIMHPARPSEARRGGVHSYFLANSDLYAHTRSRKCHFLRQLLLL